MEKQKQHNGVISFWKFAFAIMICILHGNVFRLNGEHLIFNGGSIGVEFFFIVSGYLLGHSIHKRKEEDNLAKDTWKFILNKFKKLFPYVLIAFVLIAGLDILTKERSIFSLVTSIWDLFLLRMSGIATNRINAVAWYISAMLIAMLIIYPLGRKYKKNYTCLIAPIIVILLGGFMSHEFGGLRGPMTWLGLCYKGLLRAFLELNVGIIAYEIVEKIKEINFKKWVSVLLGIVETLCFTSIFVLAQILNKSTKLDYIMLLTMTIGVIIAFSNKAATQNFCNNKFCYFLEKLSLPLYLNQMFGIYFVERLSMFNRFNYYEKLGIYLVLIIVLSILTMKLVDLYNKNKDKIFNFLKNKVVVSN